MKVSFGRVMALAVGPVLFLAVGVGSAAAQPASGSPPPPPRFEADSVSFVSAQTGFVLGARDCGRLPCTALLEKTTNGGKTWTAVPAPAVSLVPPYTPSPKTAVSTVRFANASDGWLFNPGLWQTTDGGKQWHQVSLPVAGMVVAVAASDGEAYAAVEPTVGGYDKAELYESAAGGTWTLVKGVWPANTITVSGHSAWVGIAPKISTTTNAGKTWTGLSFSCPRSALASSGVAAASPSDVAIACSDQGFPQPGTSIKDVYVSANGGKSFHEVGQPPNGGQVGELAMPPGDPQVLMMTAADGASWLYRSHNGGKTWQQTEYFDGGLDFRDLAFASATTGYVIHFSGGPVLAYGLGLLKTVDAGSIWTTVTIH